MIFFIVFLVPAIAIGIASLWVIPRGHMAIAFIAILLACLLYNVLGEWRLGKIDGLLRDPFGWLFWRSMLIVYMLASGITARLVVGWILLKIKN